MTNNYTPTKNKEDPYEPIIPFLQELSKDFNNKTEEEQEAILNIMVQEIRKINVFPIFYFNEDGIKEEIQSVIDKKDICIINHEVCTQLRNGLLLLDFLFPNLHAATTCNEKHSMYDRFQDDEILKFCLKRHLKEGLQINNMRTIFFRTSRLYWDTPINFSPMRAKVIFEYFTPPGGVIYDYSAGFGGRMLGALGSDRNFTYIATDPNTETFKNLNVLGEYIEQVTKRKNSYKLYNLCSEQLQLKKNSVDFAFSCPPFFKKEIYSNERTQSIIAYPKYSEWLENYVRPTIKNCIISLKDNGVYGVDILDYFYSGKRIPLVEDWIRIAQEEGLYLKDKIIIKSRFRKTNKENGESIYLFMKTENINLPNYVNDDLLVTAIDAFEVRVQRALRRAKMTICEYNIFGDLEKTYNSYEETGLSKEILTSKDLYNNKYYRIYRGDDIIQASIEVKQPLAQINDLYFYGQAELGRYLNVSRQAVQQAYKNKATQIVNKNIIWLK